MSKVIIGLMILVISLYGNQKFTDKDMRKYSELILKNKQSIFTTSELVKNLFSIKEKDEFETKSEYKKRVSKILGNGIFFVYKKINTIQYNIDKQEMKFSTPLQGGSTWVDEKPNKELFNKGYTGIVLELDFNNNAFPIVQKMKLNGNRYSYPYAYIKMDVNDAKKIKNKNNTFYQIIAVKVSPENILQRATSNSNGSVNGKPYLDLWAKVPMKTIGTSIISLNPQKVIFAFGIDK